MWYHNLIVHHEHKYYYIKNICVNYVLWKHSVNSNRFIIIGTFNCTTMT